MLEKPRSESAIGGRSRLHWATSVVARADRPTIEKEGIGADEVTKLLTRSNAAVLVRENGGLQGIITRYDVVQGLTGVGK